MIRRRRPCRWQRAASPSSCTPRLRPYPLPGSRPAAHQARSCLEPRPGPPRPWPPRRSYGTRLASESRPPPLRRRRLLLLLLHHHPLRPHCLHRPLLHRHLRHHLRRRRLLRRARPSDQDAATEIRTTVTPGLPASRLASASRETYAPGGRDFRPRATRATKATRATRTTRATRRTRATARSARLFPVPVFSSLRRAGPIGLALTAWDIWRRIPKKHRRAILYQARKHGPTVATKLMQQRQRRRKP
jgi:hypothetical protein